MFWEEHARLLLLVHTALAVAAVGAATHLAIWMRSYWGGKAQRHPAVRRFALLVVILHAAALLVGNAMYPTYRVRVRAEYLENPTAVASEHGARAAASAQLRGASSEQLEPRDASRARALAAVKAARWFDAKEHWLALGLLAAVALALLVWRWDPRRDEGSVRAIGPVAALLATYVAMTLWFGAIIGVLTSAWRAV